MAGACGLPVAAKPRGANLLGLVDIEHRLQSTTISFYRK